MLGMNITVCRFYRMTDGTRVLYQRGLGLIDPVGRQGSCNVLRVCMIAVSVDYITVLLPRISILRTYD